jgi:hypothetical protein
VGDDIALPSVSFGSAFFWPGSSGYFTAGISADKSFGGSAAAGEVDVVTLVVGNSGSSGIGGIDGRFSFVVLAIAGAGLGVVATGAGEVEGVVGVVGVEGVGGHGGAVLSLVSDAPVVVVSGGTSTGSSLNLFAAPACGFTGPSLIFTYRYAPTTARIVIVTSGRIEPMIVLHDDIVVRLELLSGRQLPRCAR